MIVTRGRYLTPKEKNQASSERSLHLLIKGPKKQNLDRKEVIIILKFIGTIILFCIKISFYF